MGAAVLSTDQKFVFLSFVLKKQKAGLNRSVCSVLSLISCMMQNCGFNPPGSHSPPRWPSGKASASRAGDPGFKSRLRRDFFGVESHQ